MVTHKNECVGCGFPCIGSACPYICVDHYICDSCGSEDPDTVYADEDGKYIGCSDCIDVIDADFDFICPICGADADILEIYRDCNGEIIGCDNCIEKVRA